VHKNHQLSTQLFPVAELLESYSLELVSDLSFSQWHTVPDLLVDLKANSDKQMFINDEPMNKQMHEVA